MGCAEIGQGPCQELEDKGLPTQGDSSREEFHTGSRGVHTVFSALNVLATRTSPLAVEGTPHLEHLLPAPWGTEERPRPLPARLSLQ